MTIAHTIEVAATSDPAFYEVARFDKDRGLLGIETLGAGELAEYVSTVLAGGYARLSRHGLTFTKVEDRADAWGSVTLGTKVTALYRPATRTWDILDDVYVLVASVIGARISKATVARGYVRGIVEGWATDPQGRSCYPPVYGKQGHGPRTPVQVEAVELLSGGHVAVE